MHDGLPQQGQQPRGSTGSGVLDESRDVAGTPGLLESRHGAAGAADGHEGAPLGDGGARSPFRFGREGQGLEGGEGLCEGRGGLQAPQEGGLEPHAARHAEIQEVAGRGQRESHWPEVGLPRLQESGERSPQPPHRVLRPGPGERGQRGGPRRNTAAGAGRKGGDTPDEVHGCRLKEVEQLGAALWDQVGPQGVEEPHGPWAAGGPPKEPG